MTASVFVLRISHRHGVDVTIHTTHGAALQAASEFARQWWSEHDDTDPPEDDDEVLEEYFGSGRESYDIDECSICVTPRLRIRYQQLGGHVHCAVFGPEAGKSGSLVFRSSEWPQVMANLGIIADLTPIPSAAEVQALSAARQIATETGQSDPKGNL